LWPESEWPQRPDDEKQDTQEDPEVRNIAVYMILAEESADPVNKLLQYYSSWDGLKNE